MPGRLIALVGTSSVGKSTTAHSKRSKNVNSTATTDATWATPAATTATAWKVRSTSS
ncbi:hypothetical protein ACFV9C_29525 [Kribbella sp. NPDC059898]|uniref:hypothetical protein n=1 Tax=Kribbella sp. NPDC059898 TaxID=3346995 RepID=UPI0036691C81